MLGNKDAIYQVVKQIEDLSIPYDYKAKDIPIDYLIKRFEDKYYFIPAYQRDFVWDNHRRCQFIESLLLGVPINPFFVAQNTAPEQKIVEISSDEDKELYKDAKIFEIIDGVQRFSTLVDFKNNKLKLEGLEKLTLLNDQSYSDLPVQIKRDFLSRDLRVIIISQEADETVRSDIFKRLNTSSYHLTKSEIRKGAFGGKYYDMILELSKYSVFRELCPLGDTKTKNAQHDELVLRFFAYKNCYLDYTGKPSPFFDRFVKTKNKEWDDSANWVEQKNHDVSEFYKMVNFVKNNFPDGFRKIKTAKSTPNARFEAIAVGIGLALDQNPNIIKTDVSHWVNSPEFSSLTTAGASNNKTKVVGRIEYVRDKILKGE